MSNVVKRVAAWLFLSSLIVPSLASAVNPVPLVNWPLTPTAVAPAGAGFTLTVHGTGFVAGSVVRWNGSSRSTTFVNASTLTASIPATDIAHATTASITVFSPSPAGGSSNVVFFQVRSAASWAAFRAPVHYTAGAGPQSLVVGDFNGDHKLDLAIPNPNSNNLSILLGNGDGTFRTAVEYSVGQYPVVAAVGDFNADGKLDLAVANAITNNVSILLGNGNGTFKTAVEYGAGTNPSAIAVGDFNRDGKLDLVVADVSTDAVSILLGSGTGSFQLHKSYAVGHNPQGVTVGDFNRDGKLDFAVANNFSNSVSIFLGNGDGTFRTPVNLSGLSNPASIYAADFNGDGKLDLVLANSLGYNVAVLAGNGDGSFQTPKRYPTTYEPTLALGDLNGDKKLDLAIADVGDTDIHTLLGTGTGAFQPTVGYSVPTGAGSIAVGDFNGDGKLDLAVPDGSSGVSIFLQKQPAAGVNATLSTTSLPFFCASRGFICACRTQSSLTVGNYGSQSLKVYGVSINGPFSQTNNCSAGVAPGRFCTISVTWQKPTSGSGTLSITDNVSGSPQMVSLSGHALCTP